MSELIDALKARAAAVTNETVRESLHLDVATYEKIVSFIEQEGCTLQEGLRRAVRMGVEALLLERIEVPVAPPHDYSRYFGQHESQTAPALPGYYIGQSSYSAEELAIDADNASNAAPDAGNFSRIAPPGL